MRFLWVLFFVVFCFCSNKEFSVQVMSPIQEVNVSDVKSADYERVLGVDILVFEKQVEDTTIVLEFEDFRENAIRIIWEIKIDSSRMVELDRLISKYGCAKIGKFKNQFILNCWSSNTLMLGEFITEGKQDKVRIFYQIPLNMDDQKSF